MRILIFDDDNSFTDLLKSSLEKNNDVIIVKDSYTAKQSIIKSNFDLVLSEIKDKDDNDSGLDFLKVLKASNIDIPIIMIANKSDISLAVECLKLGALDFIEKENDGTPGISKINSAIEKIFEKSKLQTNKIKNEENFKLLFVDDNVEFTKSLKFYLSKKYDLEIENDFIKARDIIKEKKYDCIFLDIKDEDKNDDRAGVKLLDYIMGVDPGISVIMLSGWSDTSVAVECLKIGATDFLEKSLKIADAIEKVDQTIKKIIDEKRKENKSLEVKENKPDYRAIDIVGESSKIQKIRNEIIEVANHDVPVLIFGETGTGKEIVASAVHIASPRKQNNFVEVDCGSIPESIFESELFGSTKGAYTGAVNNRKGKMELANNGTLFLDEIENLTLEQQAKLLRVLEDKKIYPLGSNEGKHIDFRLICATNIDLYQLVNDGKFREDLFYRLNVYKIELPLLQERGEEEIVYLINHFLSENQNCSIEKDALDLLKKYSWPGNVRELKNLLKKFEIIARTNNNSVITCDIVKEGFSKFKNKDKFKQIFDDILEYYNRNIPKMIKDFEDIAVIETYKDYNYNISKVAQIVYKESEDDNKNHREKVRKVLERNKHLLPDA